jgi:hypothetical protein
MLVGTQLVVMVCGLLLWLRERQAQEGPRPARA